MPDALRPPPPSLALAEVVPARPTPPLFDTQRLLLDNLVDVMVHTVDGRVEWISPSVEGVLGYTADALIGEPTIHLWHPDDRAGAKALRDHVYAGGEGRGRFRFRTADGTYTWIEATMRPVREPDGRFGMVGALRDISAEVAAEEALHRSEALLDTVLSHSLDATMLFNADLEVVYVNRFAASFLGIDEREFMGRRLREVLPAERAIVHESILERVVQTSTPAVFEFDTELGEAPRRFHIMVSPVIGPDGVVTGVIETGRDITERAEAERLARDLLTRDPLTGLANRAELHDELSRALAAARRTGNAAAVLILDLDRFKLVNDSLGHSVGDDLIRAAAARLAEQIRSGDLLVRLGGDEFVIVMREITSPSDALEIGERIVTAFRRPFLLDGHELYATTSVGIAIATSGAIPEDVIREADTAMYQAKGNGGDRFGVFNADLQAAVTRRRELEGQLRPALDRREFAVWFQPEVDLATGDVVALEALLRWRRPDGEIWPAGRFIDVAEDTGLIVPIGEWVLHEACRQAAAWGRQRPTAPPVVRVNLSAHQLADGGLLGVIDTALAATGLNPNLLCVEVTETVLLQRSAIVEANLAGIHVRGIRIASDDFGTGYASLAQLREHPFDIVKIDRSFIDDLAHDLPDLRLVAGTIALARNLDLDVTAEGVECAEQALLLRRLGCASAQGFLFSPAVPAAEVSLMLEHGFPVPGGTATPAAASPGTPR